MLATCELRNQGVSIVDSDDGSVGGLKGRVAAETPGGEAPRLACDMVWDWDLNPDGPLLRRCFGVEMTRCLGSSTRESGSDWRARIHPDDIAAREDQLAPCLQGGASAFSADYRARCAEGGWRRLLELGIAQADGAGAIARLSGLAIDITDPARVVLPPDRAPAANAIRALAAALLPELRNPLSPIRNALELLWDMRANEVALGAARDIIDRRLGEIAGLLRQSAAPSPIQGDSCARWAAVDLEEILEQALEAVRPKPSQDGWTLLDPERGSERLSVEGDSVQLAQAFAGLIGTLIERTGSKGRIDVRIEAGDPEILVTLGVSEEAGRPAPPPGRRANGTSPLALATNSAAFEAELLLPRRLIELHGGQVESAPHAGVAARREVRVRLPRLMPDVDSRSPGTAAPSSGTEGSKRVLVADDNDEVVDALALLLELRGYAVKTAQNGLQAVRIAESWRPDVILLDIGMPGLDGYEACRRIRAMRPEGGVRILALTGWAGREDDLAGFDGYLLKPVETDVLVRRIEDATRTRHCS